MRNADTKSDHYIKRGIGKISLKCLSYIDQCVSVPVKVHFEKSKFQTFVVFQYLKF